MNGRQALEALERALFETKVFDDRIGDAIIRAVRAALASKDAGPDPDPGAGWNDSIPKVGAAPPCMGPSARQIAHIQLPELDRLRAWKEFGENVLAVARAHPVVAVLLDKEMPQDAGETKP